MILVALNLVGACQALDTLMALGIMMLPAITAPDLDTGCAMIIAATCSYLGLILSFQFNWPSDSTFILLCGVVYLTVLSYKTLQQKTVMG